MEDSFRLNETHVFCEAIEGDLVLVHFETGLYYSIRGLGAEVWARLTDGATIAEVAAGLAPSHAVAEAEAARDIGAFVAGLQAEGILVTAPARPGAARQAFPAGRYSAPVFEIFNDMADQLLLDKIDDESQPVEWANPPASRP